METKQHVMEKTLSLFLTVVTVILVVFLSQILLSIRGEMKQLRSDIAALKQEPASAVDFEPFAPLEKNCTRCHTERRFMGIHGSSDDIHAVIKHMEMNPDLRLSPEDVDKIHASMNLLKCTKCHDEQTIKKFGSLNGALQRSILKKMEGKTGSGVTQADEKAIQRSIQTIQGF